MGFREDLIKKINIKKLVAKVKASLVPRQGIQTIDKETARRLLELANYSPVKERDIEFYVQSKKIVVLDNGLTLYNTSIEDAAMRKSPAIKEMVNIRNVFKILNDSDVVIGRKNETIDIICKEALEELDLTFKESDIDEIRLDGAASLESGYEKGIVENIELFAEILNYVSPRQIVVPVYAKIIGNIREDKFLGPVIIFNITDNRLSLIKKTTIDLSDPDRKKVLEEIVTGRKTPDISGTAVFDFLKSEVISRACNSAA